MFTSSELLDLKDQKVNLVLKINKEGRIFFIYFSFTSSKFKNLSLSRFSLLEDKLISTMTFKIPDQTIDVYTIFMPLDFSKVYNNRALFPDKTFN